MTHKNNLSSELNLARVAKLKILLARAPMCASEMAEALSAPRSTVHALIDLLMGTEIHIESWEWRSHYQVAMWALGPGECPSKPNVPKPARSLPARVYGFKPQPVRRDRMVAMLFGEARA